MAQQHALATLDTDAVIHRISNGEYGSHIAKEYGVTKAALYVKLRRHKDYVAAREAGCEIRIDQTMAQFDDLEVPRPPLKPRATGDKDTDAKAVTEWQDAVIDWKNKCRSSTVSLARVESLFRAVTWQAEREFPHRWGQKSTLAVTVDLGSELQSMCERVAGRVIEHDAPQQLTDNTQNHHGDSVSD